MQAVYAKSKWCSALTLPLTAHLPDLPHRSGGPVARRTGSQEDRWPGGRFWEHALNGPQADSFIRGGQSLS